MIFIFDLDYTLLDTEKFKLELSSDLNFQERGLDYNNFFEAVKNDDGLRKETEIFLEKIDNFLFPDIEGILLKLKQAGHQLILLSYGDKVFQPMKLEQLELGNLFDLVLATSGAKGLELKELRKDFGNDKVIIVNDNAKECLEMKEIVNSAEIFLVKGKYAQNIEHNWEEKALDDLLLI